MGKARWLFQFQGEMVSAYQIAKAYGVSENYWLIRRYLMDGMAVEAAVEAAKKYRNKPKKAAEEDVCFGIHMWEIEKLRDKIKRGDKLRVIVRYVDAYQMDSDLRRPETCTVTGVYPHLVTLRRPCGLGASKTYVELIQAGIR